MTMPEYQPAKVEAQAQQHWDETSAFEVKEDFSKEKYYCLAMLPYPSGDLHMGHVRNYTIPDIISRYQRMLGKNVLQPMGWDAFGLPAENAAIKHDASPAEWTNKNTKKMKQQLKRLGYAIDWSRELKTCDPEYYRWEQWLFLQMLDKGLAYRKKSWVNWDPVDQTVLANEQVIDGKGWRSGAPVERREIEQWFLKITDYAEELLNDLDQLDEWPEQVRTMQRNWIGRSEGVTIEFGIKRRKSTLPVYTTRPDTLHGVSYIAIATTHPLAEKAAQKNPSIQEFIANFKTGSVAEADLATQEKHGIFSGITAINPANGEEIPVWITNYVLMEYGTGAVMAVPAHDERDHEFALTYNRPILPVLKAPKDWDYQKAAFLDKTEVINSDKFNGLKGPEGISKIIDKIEKAGYGTRQVNYRLRDWGISRQRYWGTPIPMQYVGDKSYPVPADELPVELPLDVKPDGHGSPLAKDKAFKKTSYKGKAATRETDTMDTFMESSWYFLRYCCPDSNDAMLDARVNYWTSVDHYIGGVEHAVLHLLYSRFIHKVIRDLGLVNCDEPFKKLLTQGMVLKDGAKMSKSKGNTVSPESIIKEYGADTARFFITFAAPPEQSLEWSDKGVDGAYRFLNRVWQLAHTHADALLAVSKSGAAVSQDTSIEKARYQLHSVLQQATHDMERQQFNTVAAACMKLYNTINELDPKDEAQLSVMHEGFNILLRVLNPICPHITHSLWQLIGLGDDILTANWPKVDSQALQVSNIEVVIQVNGKVRQKLTLPAESDDQAIEDAAKADPKIQGYLEGKTVRKVIVIKQKLVNIVVS